MTPEAEYLLASFPPENSLAGDSVNWAELLELADSHGVLSLLCQSRGAALPFEFAVRLRERRARSLLLAGELAELLDQFQKQGIEVLALKGPVLSDLLYRQVSSRSSGDLDLLVRPADFPQAEAFLERLGFAPTGDPDDYHRDFEREGTFVELHFGTSSPSAPRFDLAGAWSRSRIIEFRGYPVRFLSPLDLILYLAIHGLKHRFARLIWVFDVANALSTLSATDTSHLLDYASSLNLRNILLLSCEIARLSLDTPLPSDITAAIAAHPKLAAVAAEMADAILASTADPANFIHDPTFYLQFADSRAGRWSQRLSFFLPTQRDRQWAARHSISAKCAPLVRPFRILRRHGPAPALRALFPRSGNRP